MKYLSNEINKGIVTAVEEKFETVLFDNIDRFIDFFNTLTELREAFPDYDEKMMILNTENAKKICDSINIQIDKHYQRDESLSFESLFPDLVDHLDNLVSYLEPLIKVQQSEARFKELADDKNIRRLAKRIKITAFKSQQLSLRLINPVLKILKKQPVNIKYWDQKIPLRNVGFSILRNKLLNDLSLVYNGVFKLLCERSIAYWKYDESYDEEYISNFIKSNNTDPGGKPTENPEKVIAELESLKEEIKINALTAVEKCILEFEANCEKAGTIELSKSSFNDKKVLNHFKNTIDEFNQTIREWDNTLYALGEDWELNYDLESTRYSAIEVFLKFGKSLSVKNKIQIYPQFKEILGSLNFIDEKLRQSTTEIQDLERLLAYSKEHLQKILLSSTIPNLINSISDLRLQEMIDEAKSEVKSQLDSITEVRAFVKTASYDKKIKSSDIDKIYPREFVSFNTLPKFLTTLDEIKLNNIVELKNIQAELINLGNMSDFGLESAITAAATENLSTSDIAEIAVEGIKISQDKQEQLLNSFNKVCSDVLENLRSSIAMYTEEMFSFTQSSKIIEIKLQLAKAKARAKAGKARDKIFSSAKNAVPVVFEKAKGYYKKGSRVYTNTRRQFGLTESKESITSEISDFLSASNKTVGKLPYIYRRLFQLLPLENDRLYISRQVEENQLALAYNSWLKGGYAPVIISSEKGGGITSFLNIFLKRLDGKNIFKRLTIKPSVYKQQDFLKVIGEIFLPEKFQSFEELVIYLNSSDNKQVIVVENLQHLYLRSVQGFVCLKILTDIISKTSRNIFWITSSTLYANEFLNKAIRLNDVFGYHIFLKQIESSHIIKLIKMRNSISGYNIKYEPNTMIPRNRDFEKLAYEQKQNLLEKEFFDSLNKFAQSNISLALLFWLSSIIELKERKVYINADFGISNSILDSLTSEKVFVLQSLVLHDGLNAKDIARTINYSVDEITQLTQILHDDGVLIENNGVYLINPLLYRQSVILLKSKNLL